MKNKDINKSKYTPYEIKTQLNNIQEETLKESLKDSKYYLKNKQN